MKTIFELCKPRSDVLEGRVRDEEFAADLSKVVNATAVPEYANPEQFFRYTYPTRGLKTLLETVCRRLSGKGGELNSVIRLDTQFGGGKTHSLIALVHAVRNGNAVPNIGEFMDGDLILRETPRIAALSGESIDILDGSTLEPGVKSHSLWGEMAYRLAGSDGFERVRKGDERHIAPGSDTIMELFGDEPVLILIDEVSGYLRRAARAFDKGVDQFAAFLQSLIKAVSATPKAALVCTLAIRPEDLKAVDAYETEHHLIVNAFNESMNIASRTLLQLDPTEEDETVNILQRRLFESVDKPGAEEIIQAYVDLWKKNRDSFSPDAASQENADQFRKGYPLHPETLNVMVEKMSSLASFQRTRGMLRLLARTIHWLWETRPVDAYAIHPHHIDLTHQQIRTEFTTKLNQGAYASALAADIAAVSGKDPATAQRIDTERFPGQTITVSAATTIFLNTMAFGDSAQGLTPEHLRYSIASPAIDPQLIETARRAFKEESLYLDDRPGAPLRFRMEPNLTQIINQEMKIVELDEIRNYLRTRIGDLYKGSRSDFELIQFPETPMDIPDEIGGGRPFLVVLHYDDCSFSDHPDNLPPNLTRLATKKGSSEEMRTFVNNVVFVGADEKLSENMKTNVRKRLALESIVNGTRMDDLAEHQKNKIKDQYKASDAGVAISVLQCYRHIFYPADTPFAGGSARLGHTVVEIPNTSDKPGDGQRYVKRALKDQKKLLLTGDDPDAPSFVRDKTMLKTKGQMSTAALLKEYRKLPNLSILLDMSPLVGCVRKGIEQGLFIYREGNDQLWGKGDPEPSVKISDDAFIHTLEDAKSKNLWPRPEPEKEPELKKTEVVGGWKKTEEKANEIKDSGKPKKPSILCHEGALKKSLVHLFEDARAGNVGAISKLTVSRVDYQGAKSLMMSLTTYREAEIVFSFETEFQADGINTFQLIFSGTIQKFNPIKSYLETSLKTAIDSKFEGYFELRFSKPLSTGKETSDAFIKNITGYGSPEVLIEAEPAGQA